MIKGTPNFKTIDEYIELQPTNIQFILKKIRQTIRKSAPNAQESISYQMPAFKLNGPLVYFGAFKNHVGFFPTSGAIPAFKEELSKYKTSKGTIQFQYDEPIPYDLIAKIVKFRVEENLAKTDNKKDYK